MSSKKLFIVGIGPGTKDYLTPAAKNAVKKADCLIGAKRLISLFKNKKIERIYIEGHFSEIVPYIKKYKNKKTIALLVSGDPGLYSLLERISCNFRKDEYEIIPGISTVQLAFSKIGEGWQDAKIISLHGRGISNLADKVKKHPKVFLFTDGDFPPDRIASYLFKNKISNRRAVVFTDLAYPNERIIDTDLVKLSRQKGFGLCVMIIKK